MAQKPVDLKDGEEMHPRRVVLSLDLEKLLQKDAKKYAAGNVSIILREILRRHYKMEEQIYIG